ncbi:hypothetical protein LCGC14_1801530 [marine sediment metagenome]|uniref:Uncharacterized protein n=1 Tax=marine sediment metagenome TaxID=412755 RepID=A0A0F9JP45_9ZZZZ
MWAVYKTFKHADAYDSPHLWYFEKEIDAKAAVKQMTKLKEQKLDGVFAYLEGWEWDSYWDYIEYDPKPTTFEDFKQQIEKELKNA